MTIMVYVYCPLSVVTSHHLTVNIYHNGHHGCYLTVKIVSNFMKKAKGQKFEKE